MLATLSQVKRHIGIPSSNTAKDALLTQIIVGVSGFIETQTNRVFGIREFSEILDGTREDEIFLKQYPVRDILTLTIDGNEIDLDAEEEAGTIVLDGEIGSVFRDGRFGSTRKGVRISYTAGYDLPADLDESGDESGDAGEDLPAAINAAAIRLSARVYERRTAEGVATVSPTGISISYKDAIDADVAGVLEAHTKRRV